MKAGRMKHRITIQALTETQLPSGQITGEWEDYVTVWAEINCTSATVLDESGAVQHEGLYRFYIRHRDDITAEMRVIWNNRIFTMVAPPADWKMDNLGMTLITKELV